MTRVILESLVTINEVPGHYGRKTFFPDANKTCHLRHSTNTKNDKPDRGYHPHMTSNHSNA